MYCPIISRLTSAFPPILPPLFEMAENIEGYLIGEMCAIMNGMNEKEGNVMAEKLHALACAVAATFYGATTFSLFPSSDYSTYISGADKIAQNSWERTGFMLKQAIDNNRGVLNGNGTSRGE